MEYKPSVLIVDDLKDNILGIKLILKKENYEIYEANDGLEAVQKTKELKPDIILMDAMMPKMDGFEASAEIRKYEEFKRTPILMITALSAKEDKIKAIKCGINDFISKPIDRQEIIARCRSYTNAALINKKYILASKNPITDLPNKISLIEDLKSSKFSKLVLFRVFDYELLEEFYSENITSNIILEFSKQIYSLLAEDCEGSKLYHIHEGEFALLKNFEDKRPDISNAMSNCEQFSLNVKENIIKIGEYEYDIDIVISFCFGEHNTYEHARLGLNYAVKNKQRIVFANDIIEQVHKDAVHNIETIKMVKTALNSNKIISYFQPLYNNKTKKIEKYESLVRLIDSNDKIISPFFFLDTAKKGKYYTQITEHVINNSLDALKRCDMDISINLSATDIEDDYIRDLLLSYFSMNKSVASRIVLELLEDESFKNFDIVKGFIHKVKEFGVKIAIDDFGSGYSNFERLLDFEPDILKIDGSLIKNIHTDHFSRNIVETIYGFASKMGIKTVAEFVSNKEIFDIVNEIGIEYTQGYYISEPLASVDS